MDALSKLIEVIVGLKITGSAIEMPLPLENDVLYSLDVLHMPPGASTIAADPKLPPESSKLAGFLPALPVTKEPHFQLQLSGQTLNPYSSSQKRN